jgi:hypothetical protein
MTMIRALTALLLLMANTTPSGQPLPKQPGDFTPAAQSQVVSWQLRRVPPPSALYVNVNDKLVVFAASSQVSEVVTINYRLLRAADGVIVPGQFTVAPAAFRGIAGQQAQMAEGFLLSVSVTAAAAITRGQTFVRVFLGSGPFGASEPSYMLMADYATNIMAPAHPNGRVLSPVEGPGNLRNVAGLAPGAGSEWLISVPANARWRVQSVLATLTTSAAVANRGVALRVFEASAPAGGYPTNFAQVASTTVVYSFGAGLGVQSSASGFSNMGFPSALIIGGPGTNNLQSLTGSIQAGDQWGAPTALVEEWLDNV